MGTRVKHRLTNMKLPTKPAEINVSSQIVTFTRMVQTSVWCFTKKSPLLWQTFFTISLKPRIIVYTSINAPLARLPNASVARLPNASVARLPNVI